jgi:hypothetical protein
MKLHGNAALTLRHRRRVVALRQQGVGLAETAQAVGASPQDVREVAVPVPG